MSIKPKFFVAVCTPVILFSGCQWGNSTFLNEEIKISQTTTQEKEGSIPEEKTQVEPEKEELETIRFDELNFKETDWSILEQHNCFLFNDSFYDSDYPDYFTCNFNDGPTLCESGKIYSLISENKYPVAFCGARKEYYDCLNFEIGDFHGPGDCSDLFIFENNKIEQINSIEKLNNIIGNIDTPEKAIAYLLITKRVFPIQKNLTSEYILKELKNENLYKETLITKLKNGWHLENLFSFGDRACDSRKYFIKSIEINLHGENIRMERGNEFGDSGIPCYLYDP